MNVDWNRDVEHERVVSQLQDARYWARLSKQTAERKDISHDERVASSYAYAARMERHAQEGAVRALIWLLRGDVN